MTCLVTTALAACDRPDDGTVTHIEDLPRLVAEREVRIGDFDDPEVGFSRVFGLDVDDEGHLYVGEATASEIRVYTPEGDLLRRIGGGGSGPGEFERPPRFGVLGDTVWAIDTGAMRITLFDRDGTVLSTGRIEDVTVPLPSAFGHALPHRMRGDGRFVSHLSRVSYNRDGEDTGVAPTDSIPVPIVLFDASGAVTDTIGWAGRPPPRLWRPPSEAPSAPEVIEVAGRRVWVPSAPTTLPWWRPLLDGYVLVETPIAQSPDEGRFTVTRLGLEGDTVYSRTLRYTPSPYSSEDLDSIAARAARGEPGGMAPYVPGRGPPSDWKVAANRLRAAMEFPDFQLPIDHRPWVAPDDGLWLRRTAEGEPSAREWILLDPDGRPKGRVELPSKIQILWSDGETFWAVVPDEYEVPWLERFGLGSG